MPRPSVEELTDILQRFVDLLEDGDAFDPELEMRAFTVGKMYGYAFVEPYVIAKDILRRSEKHSKPGKTKHTKGDDE